MSTGEVSAQSVDAKVIEHEEAAHEKRNWVRLTFDCNNHCVFCLDTLTHDGQMRDRNEVKEQILDGARKGAQRLILSGGEPTMHPRYVDFIRLGKLAGYRKIQTVTNGRMFAYEPFLTRCLNAGLDEITFSLHGPNARIHDALVGVKGAFEQEVQGLRNAMADGRPIVNIDIVLNRGNVKHVPDMLEMFINMGVREYDLLHVIPFGNAYREGREVLFYDLEAMRPYLIKAFDYSKRPDVHIWLNRFPVQHLEGYESLIQDPYKLNDEVKGRKEEYEQLLTRGVDLDCREPARCRLCYLERVCDTLYDTRDRVRDLAFETLRVDTEWEAHQGPIWGGDPASRKRARAQTDARADHVGDHVVEGSTQDNARAKLRLPVLGAASEGPPVIPPTPLPELAARAGAKVLWVVAPDAARALAEIQRFPTVNSVTLELTDYQTLSLCPGARRAPRRSGDPRRAHAQRRPRGSLALDAAFEVSLALTKTTAPWLLSLPEVPSRLALHQPSYDRLSDAARHDVDLRDFFSRFTAPVPAEGVPACVTGRAEPPRSPTLDAAMMTPDGQLEVFRYIKRYIAEHYRARSLRCKPCVYADTCDGMHINYIRAHGYGLMQPVLADAE
ncbi:MAG: radical SAM protein [Deltaproteobacteria bacterium]|nr:radical SAM protein [Deltaproteobacteria bacterium]